MSNCGPPYLTTPPLTQCASILELSGGTSFQLGDSPPASFFNLGGIYGQRFVSPMQTTFDALYTCIYATDPSNAIDPFNNTDERLWVQRMSQWQRSEYEQQLRIFRQVYAYNLGVYRWAATTQNPPLYYRFRNQTELSQYKAGVALVQKLYEVNERYPLACLFFLPFPPFCP
jgi:hypothetical protein